MRFALLIAFVCSVAFHTEIAEARPGAVASEQARKPKAHKRRAAKGAKAKTTKHTKSARKAKAKARAKEVAVADDEAADVATEAPDPVPAVQAAPPAKREAVAQATDDEEPPSGPKKR